MKLAKTPLEKTLIEATSNENWNPSNKLLNEIADHTYDYADFNFIMKFVWEKLNSKTKSWRKILKVNRILINFIKIL